MPDQPPQPAPTPSRAPDPAPSPSSRPAARKRRRVFHTAGLTASAAVLALSIQAGSLNGDDGDGQASTYGDTTILDPDAALGDVTGSDAEF